MAIVVYIDHQNCTNDSFCELQYINSKQIFI